MPLGRVDNGDVILGKLARTEQLVADGKTSGATTDYNYLVAL
jgi:hypothetical protein